MTQPGDPPASPGSGRSIYERLGLTPMAGTAPPRRPIPIAPPGSGRPVLRYVAAALLVFGGLAAILLYAPLDIGHRAQDFAPSTGSEDAQRMDFQDTQIKALQMRVEVLEMKLRALQEVNGYRATDEAPRAPAGIAPARPLSRIGQPAAP